MIDVRRVCKGLPISASHNVSKLPELPVPVAIIFLLG